MKQLVTQKILDARAGMKASDDRRDAGLTTPADVRRFDDIPYGPDGTWQILDVYRPRSAGDAPLPVIVNVHGGGWIYGTKETYQFYCMDLCRRGFAVVNFTYRLAPENPFPASLEDTRSVFGWVLDNAGQYGFDPKHVFAVGDSAGGHILALFCELCVNPALAAKYAFSAPNRFVPTAVALNCGAYRYRRARLAIPKYVNTTKYVTPAFPPAFLMTSTGDFLKNEAVIMAQCLTDASVPFELHVYGDDKNRLGHVFHVDIKSADAALCNDAECAFFRKYC